MTELERKVAGAIVTAGIHEGSMKISGCEDAARAAIAVVLAAAIKVAVNSEIGSDAPAMKHFRDYHNAGVQHVVERLAAFERQQGGE